MHNSTNEEDLNFELLPGFTEFIFKHKLDAYVRKQISISRQLDLPILRILANLSEDELFNFSIESSTSFLQYFIENKAFDLIQDSIQQWLSDDLPQNISRYQLSAKDITLISFIRKQSLLHFVTEYTTDNGTIIGIINELDKYILHSDTMAFETYLKIMDEKINAHVHFIEKIAETSPGAVYVYDLLEQKEIYTNGKSKEIFGYSSHEFENPSWRELQHPDDLERTIEHFKSVQNLKDKEIRILERRVKKHDGQYRWFRDYLSIFKRDVNNIPTQIIGLSMDINKEKFLAEQLHFREEQLLEAQELAEIGSFVWNLEEDNSVSTPQLQKILELEQGANLRTFMDRIHPADKAQVEVALDQALKSTGNYDAEFRYLSNDKNKEKILWSRGVVTYQDEKPKYMRGTVMNVTERHHMIQKLKRSEELYKQAQALTHIGNWTYDLGQDKLTWTDELYRIFGLEPQSVQFKINDLLAYLHPKDKEEFIKTASQLQNLNTQFDYIPRIVLKNGVKKYLCVKTEVLRNDKGEVYKLIGTAQDITQQKLNEKQLRESENFIKKITDATPSIIGAYNIHTGKYLFVNRAFEKLGYSTDELLENGSRFLLSIIHPDDLENIQQQNLKALQIANSNSAIDLNELVVEFKYRLLSKNGEYRWFHTYGTVFDRNVKNEVEHVLNISIDITDRVTAEEKVLEQANFIEHIADASPTILYLFDIDLNAIVYINHEITPVLGYLPNEIMDMGNAVKNNLFYPEDHSKVGAQTTWLDKEQLFTEYECRLRDKQGNWRWFLIREIAFKQNEDGRFKQVLCAALDIDDRKKIEETLYHKTIELQQSNSNLEEFAYVASHDLKEPLRKITTFGDRLLAKEKDSLKPESQVYLDKMIDSSRRMQRMIDDLLSISMISGEKTFERTSLQTIFNEVVQTLEFKIEENKAVVQSDDLPVTNVIVSQFRQLFQNLISNSLKFHQPNIAPVITITHKFLRAPEVKHHNLQSSKKYLQLNFADNGIGFDEKYAEKIFSIFHRLHGRSEYEGTGIGLAICRKIAENHSGKIFATANENGGSNFTVIIPA